MVSYDDHRGLHQDGQLSLLHQDWGLAKHVDARCHDCLDGHIGRHGGGSETGPSAGDFHPRMFMSDINNDQRPCRVGDAEGPDSGHVLHVDG